MKGNLRSDASVVDGASPTRFGKLLSGWKRALMAFLGYCLWVCLKKKAEAVSSSLTPQQILDQRRRIALVEVWLELRDGRQLCLPQITQPEPAQQILLTQLNLSFPEQPPPRVHAAA